MTDDELKAYRSKKWREYKQRYRDKKIAERKYRPIGSEVKVKYGALEIVIGTLDKYRNEVIYINGIVKCKGENDLDVLKRVERNLRHSLGDWMRMDQQDYEKRFICVVEAPYSHSYVCDNKNLTFSMTLGQLKKPLPWEETVNIAKQYVPMLFERVAEVIADCGMELRTPRISNTSQPHTSGSSAVEV